MPDPAWEHTDSNGHFHAFAADGKTPTLETYSVHIGCDGSCGGVCEGEGYDENRWKCAVCGEEVEPRFVPDWDARTIGIPVVNRRWVTVTIQGSGELPLIGRDNGDGMMTLEPHNPSDVTVRVRTADGEMIGLGHVGNLAQTYSSRGNGWTLRVDMGQLLPRLAGKEHAAEATT